MPSLCKAGLRKAFVCCVARLQMAVAQIVSLAAPKFSPINTNSPACNKKLRTGACNQGTVAVLWLCRAVLVSLAQVFRLTAYPKCLCKCLIMEMLQVSVRVMAAFARGWRAAERMIQFGPVSPPD